MGYALIEEKQRRQMTCQLLVCLGATCYGHPLLKCLWCIPLCHIVAPIIYRDGKTCRSSVMPVPASAPTAPAANA